MKKSLIVLGTLFLLASCGQIKEKYGKAACKCVEEMTNIIENPENFDEAQFQEIEEKTMKCVTATSKQFKDLISQDEAKAAIKEECPNSYKYLFPND